jgi:DUF438 domain-containing protein
MQWFTGTPQIETSDSFEDANKKLKTILESELKKKKDYTPDLQEWIRYITLIHQTAQMNGPFDLASVEDFNKKARDHIVKTLADKNKSLYTSLYTYNILLQTAARQLKKSESKEIRKQFTLPNIPTANILQKRLNTLRTRGGKRSKNRRRLITRRRRSHRK